MNRDWLYSNSVPHHFFFFQMDALGQLEFDSASDFEISAKLFAKNKGFTALFKRFPGMYVPQLCDGKIGTL